MTDKAISISQTSYVDGFLSKIFSFYKLRIIVKEFFYSYTLWCDEDYLCLDFFALNIQK